VDMNNLIMIVVSYLSAIVSISSGPMFRVND
jgi:hypothetical protein